MKRRILTIAIAMCVAAGSALAQVGSGNISGAITDEQGAVLPGVLITLTSADRTATFTTATDGRYRFLALPPGQYTVTAALTGFGTVVREQIEVRVGQNVDLPIQMRVATLQETVTVTGESPLVDARAMGTATNFTQDELSRIPTSRDPWALLRTVPGVVVDRVNIAGNETGQQSGFTAKGIPSSQSTWTLDGVVITDSAAVGASPSYFDYDSFEEIQISTAGADIRQPTGGVGLNMVVKRGTNAFRGGFKGYYTNDALEATNIPDELAATGVTAETTDHNDEIMEWGGDVGGPIVRDRLWFWGSYVEQDIRLFRRQVRGIDRTVLKTVNLKTNWQATQKDMISFLWFNGDKIKEGRSTGFSGIEARTATWNQGNFTNDSLPPGLFKIQDDRVFSSSFFLSAKYAYYNTGFTLDPIGGLDMQGGRSARLGETYGSFVGQYFRRPQHTINVDSQYFFTGAGGNHELKVGFARRQSDAATEVIYPGDMVYAFDDPTRQYVNIYRTGNSLNRAYFLSAYIGDTYSRDRLTLDVGVRFDRQNGEALPTATESNTAFPSLVPGVEFQGYQTPFTFNNLSPRLGMTYALDDSRRTLLRASYASAPGQLYAGLVGYMNPSASNGFVRYGWIDRNGDHLAQPGEVDFNDFITSGGGFNPQNPTAVTSSNRIDPGFKTVVSHSVVAGIDRELRANLALQVSYSYTRASNYEAEFRVNAQTGGAMGPEFYESIAPITGTLPASVGGGTYSIPAFRPNAAMVTAAGGGFLLTNYDGYYSQYNGVEAQLIKRMSNRWMGRVSLSWNDPREYYDMAVPVNYLGNPTRRDTESLKDGGIFAPRSAGSGAGDVFMAGKWTLNINGAYQLPAQFELAANLFGKDGTPLPLQATSALGVDTGQRVLVSPDLDTEKLEQLWNLDVRLGKTLRSGRVTTSLNLDVFNVFNANNILNRIRDVASSAFYSPTQNLSPRIVRFGARIGF
jgi:hypothetical protein